MPADLMLRSEFVSLTCVCAIFRPSSLNSSSSEEGYATAQKGIGQASYLSLPFWNDSQRPAALSFKRSLLRRRRDEISEDYSVAVGQSTSPSNRRKTSTGCSVACRAPLASASARRTQRGQTLHVELANREFRGELRRKRRSKARPVARRDRL